jgi:endoglucanase
MSELIKFLRESTAIPGLPGFEKPVADMTVKWFAKHSADVWQDAFFNVFARMGGNGPKVLVAAHNDGLGLMVNSFEDDGFLGFSTVGGFDPRVLPGLEVMVHGREGDYFGVIGAKPPHVLSEDDRKKVLKINELFIDVGMAREKVAKLIGIGDIVSLRAPLLELAGDAVTSRALDDRAGVAVMLEAMKALKKHPCRATVLFEATTREEVGHGGALTGAFALNPDLAVIIDVAHGAFGKSDDPRMVPIAQVNTATGPMIDRRLKLRLEQCAKKLKLDLSYDFMAGRTSTDGDSVQPSRAGVPIVLLQIPLRYMHTSVESLRTGILASAGKLLAAFLSEVDEGWEAWPCI